jgi:uncharacterized membrane protein YbjE (DUF340 family)
MLTLPLLAGILSGYLLRRMKKINLDRAAGAIVVVLIFSLGFSIGSDAELLGSLPRIGLSALVMALSAVLFSILFTVWARKKVGLT